MTDNNTLPITDGSAVERFVVFSDGKGRVVGVLDEDFGYDALLKIDGDFPDDEKLEYVRAACAALNASASRIPTGPQCDRKPEDWPCIPHEPGGIEQRLRALADELVNVDCPAADQLHNIADGVKRRALTKGEK